MHESFAIYLMFQCDFDVMENLENLEESRELNTALALSVDRSATMVLWVCSVGEKVWILIL